jgi:hypothetical protein
MNEARIQMPRLTMRLDAETNRGVAMRWAGHAIGGMILISVTTWFGESYTGTAAPPAAAAVVPTDADNAADATPPVGAAVPDAATPTAEADASDAPAGSSPAPGAPDAAPNEGEPPPRDPAAFVLVRLGLPVLLMFSYAWSGHRFANKANLKTVRAARIGQLADSIYFLGFLWTLWALIDSFVIHQLSIATAVFRAFGYALVTTTAGMFLRLMLLQFQYTGDEWVEAGAEEIEKELRNFSSALSTTSKAIKGFQVSADKAMADWTQALTHSVTALTKSVDDVAQGTRTLATSIGTVADSAGRLKTEVASVQQLTAQLGAEHRRFIEQATAATAATKTNAEQLAHAAAANRAFVAQTNAGAAAVAQQTTAVATTTQAVSRVGESLREVAGDLNALERRLAAAAGPSWGVSVVSASSSMAAATGRPSRRSRWRRLMGLFGGSET